MRRKQSLIEQYTGGQDYKPVLKKLREGTELDDHEFMQARKLARILTELVESGVFLVTTAGMVILEALRALGLGVPTVDPSMTSEGYDRGDGPSLN